MSALARLRASVAGTDASLLRTVHKILSDELPQSDDMLLAINNTINDEAVDTEGVRKKGSVSGGPLAGRNRKIYAVRAERKLLCVTAVDLSTPELMAWICLTASMLLARPTRKV